MLLGTEKKDGSAPLDVILRMNALGWASENQLALAELNNGKWSISPSSY
jgi:hypothetical protein